MALRWLAIALIASGCTGTIVTGDGDDDRPAGDPAAGGDATAGDPSAGDASAGDPSAGDPSAGDPSAGDPSAGDPMAGDPTPGDPSGGDSTPPVGCVPFCAMRACGTDGCGGSCGTCAVGTCNAGGQCQPTSCSSCTSDCPQGCFDLGACTPSGGTLETHGNILTAGVILTPASASTSFELYYRPPGAPAWWRGHDGAPLPDGRVASSIFGLAPATTYEIQVLSGSEVACTSVTTKPLDPPHSTSTTIYADANASPGGNGTAGSPFDTIQAAVDAASAGTDIIVRPGTYHEEIEVTVSGASAQYVRLLGEPGAILDGSDPIVVDNGLAWTGDGANVWYATWTGDPQYLARNGARMYHYLSLADLRTGTGDDSVPIDEGFITDGGRLYVRCLTDPATATWQIPVFNAGIELDADAWIWIEGLEIRFYGSETYAKGIDVRDSDHVVIRHNHIHDMVNPVLIRNDSHDARVEYNQVHQSTVPTWPWDAVKGTDHENSAIRAAGGTGAIVAFNEIHSIFNGVYTGSWGDKGNTTIAFDVDVYGNRMLDTNDDGMEPEGACINNRFWGNVVDRPHSGVSLAPITWGPVWVVRNRFTDYTGTGFKVSNDSSGPVFLYHNTCYTDVADQNGMDVSGPFANMVLRNNIVRGSRYAFEMSMAASPGNDLDYDNWFTPRGAPVIKWDNIRYDDVAAWCSATGLECSGQPLAPGLIAPSSGQFALAAGSDNINAGVHIYGINDGYVGSAPDIGYLELGQPEAPPLP